MIRGVRNPMKMSDIGFLKTESNWTDPKTDLGTPDLEHVAISSQEK